MSLSAEAVSSACARLSSAQGPAISASGSALPNRTRPTLTTAFGAGWIVASVRIAAEHALPTSRGQPSGGKTSARKWFGRLYQPALLDRRLDERREQRMRREWTRFQLGVELHGDEPGMLFVFNDLRQDTVGGHPREAHAPPLEPALVIRVHV